MMRFPWSAVTCVVLLAVCSVACAADELVEPEHPGKWGAEPAPGTKIAHPVDGSIMVWVPSGFFIMGADEAEARKVADILDYEDPDKFAAFEWFPKRREYVEGYFIDMYEVTRQRWDAFIADTGHEPAKANGHKTDTPEQYALHPAVSITWAEAQKYANWAGKALPTEKQWEKAARGTDGRLYPWGDDPPTSEHGVFPSGGEGKDVFQAVGSKPKGVSPYGCMDMSGNVYEWTSEWMEPYPNNPRYKEMLGYTGHEFGLLRGGSFYHAMHALSCAKRFGFRADETYFHVGFRTVWSPPEDYFKSDAYRQARDAVAAREDAIEKMREQAVKDTPYWGG